MKYTILFGSPHKCGHTAMALKYFLESRGIKEYEIIYAYSTILSPCIDCGACDNGQCVKNDFLVIENIYKKITSSDAFILASPIYFNSVPAPLKCIIDRLQPYYIKKFIQGKKEEKKSKGILIMSGGEKEKAGTKDMLKTQLKYVFDVLGFEIEEFIYLPNTDNN